MPIGWSITQIWVKPPDLSEPSNLSDHPELRESRSDHPELSASPIYEGGHLPDNCFMSKPPVQSAAPHPPHTVKLCERDYSKGADWIVIKFGMIEFHGCILGWSDMSSQNTLFIAFRTVYLLASMLSILD